MEDEGHHDEERIHISLDDLVMRNNHKCAEAQTCNHGWTDHSQYFGYGHDSCHKFKCEDGRGAPNREKQGCRTYAIRSFRSQYLTMLTKYSRVASQECGLCRGYVCRSCYDANNLIATEAGERMTRVQVGDFLRMSVARREIEVQ